MDIIISAILQGVLWSILSLGLFVSYRILKIADMTTEGAFPLGAATCMISIHHGVNPILAMLLSFVAGALAGAITAFLITICRIPGLLSGILTMTGLISINLRVLGRPNLPILDYPTIFSNHLKENNMYGIIIIGAMIISIIVILLNYFFKTEIGQSIIATGDNPKMAVSLGISTKKMIFIGLMLSNGLIAFCGSLLTQSNGYADVNSGQGVVVIALAAIIIGEIIFKNVSFVERLICTIYGAIIYQLLLVVVLQLRIVEANDFKLVSAILIGLFLTMPQSQLKKKLKRGGND